MLVVVIGVFLCTEPPLMVITALHTLSNRFLSIIINRSYEGNMTPIIVNDGIVILLPSFYLSFYTFLDYEVAKNIVLIINALICLSYPVNFAIYCGMSRSLILAQWGVQNLMVLMVLVLLSVQFTNIYQCFCDHQPPWMEFS